MTAPRLNCVALVLLGRFLCRSNHLGLIVLHDFLIIGQRKLNVLSAMLPLPEFRPGFAADQRQHFRPCGHILTEPLIVYVYVLLNVVGEGSEVRRGLG